MTRKMGRLIQAIILAIIAAPASGYFTGEPLVAFLVSGLVASVAMQPKHSVIAAASGIASWYVAGFILLSEGSGRKVIKLLSEIAGIPDVALYIIPLLLGLLVSMLLAYSISSLVVKR
ncbi:MAG: hypothetical protein F7C81_06950 [Desulfurococcales archaeon]|nr:hypothetical protein [Desulfurococcales archaeon]